VAGNLALWVNSHQLPQAIELGSFNLNSPLAPGAALKVLNRRSLAADHE
jgi:hypothetical protein